MATDKALC